MIYINLLVSFQKYKLLINLLQKNRKYLQQIIADAHVQVTFALPKKQVVEQIAITSVKKSTAISPSAIKQKNLFKRKSCNINFPIIFAPRF